MKRTILIALLILLAAVAGLGAWRLRAARGAPPPAPTPAEEVPCGPAAAPTVDAGKNPASAASIRRQGAAESKPAPKPLLGGTDEPGCAEAAKPADPFAAP